MSTKKTREALELLGRLSDEADEIVREALAEVEAIEKAAKALDDNLAAQVFASNPQDVEAALDLLESIAKQST